jgi:hypothetical protein
MKLGTGETRTGAKASSFEPRVMRAAEHRDRLVKAKQEMGVIK